MAEARVERRLAAIMAGDVAGYSRLMGVDEEGTLARLNAHRREFLEPKIAGHRGRIVKRTGDGVLVEFASAVDATRCAVEIQSGMNKRNETEPAERRIELRIGIHVGDIILDEGDIFGDGVNIAARLESLATPGGLCISDDTYRQVRGKIDVDFQDMGEQELKNIARPVRVYQSHPELAKVADGAPTTNPPLPDKPSIAVLPFQNMSADREQEYFVDGMVEDIITGLSRIKWFFVIARNSSFAYKGRIVDVKRVGRELGVRYVLEGSVRKAVNRVRITAQLIDAASGAHIWAEQYDRSIDDVFALQDEITMRVVGAIEPSLRKAEIERVKRRRPDSLDAYNLVLRSLPHITAKPKDAEAAIPLLQKAIQLDPNYGLAHAFLSFSFHVLTYRLREQGRAEAIDHAHKAIAFGNDDPTALAFAAFIIAFQEHELATSFRLFDRALEISNSNVIALRWSSIILAWAGRADLAIERAQQALRLSPFDDLNFSAHMGLSIAYFHLGRFREAAEAAQNALEINPGFSLHLALLAGALLRDGRTEEAKKTAERLLAVEPSFTIHVTAHIVGLVPDVIAPFVASWREVGLPE